MYMIKAVFKPPVLISVYDFECICNVFVQNAAIKDLSFLIG